MQPTKQTEEYKYANIYDPLLFLFIRSIRKKVVALVKKHQYKKILDVCCGTGDQLKLLKKHGFDAKGIDLSESMLNVALGGKLKADCRLQDATQMRFDNDLFDLSMVVFALHEKHTDSAKKILEEMLRVTRENGHILIVDYEITHQTGPVSKALIYFIEWIAGGEHYRHFKAYLKAGGLPDLLSGMLPIEERSMAPTRHGIVLTLLQKSE